MSSEKLPVELSKGVNGLEEIILREARGSSAEVYLYGGHVTSWKNEHGEELLFVSSKFSNHGPLQSHGFARNRFWSIGPDPPLSEEDMKIWPHSYEFRLRVALGLGGDLMLTSRIRNMNTDGKPFTFAFAYHTYFSVDWIYLSAPTKIAILDHEKNKDGLPDDVVWNPWDKKAKALADFGDDEYKHMLCIEAATIEKPITLTPGEEWKGSQELCAVPPSYCGGLLDARKVLQCADKMHY
ncbi:hypothetical protein GOBAR_DD15042 [Gossypium barbadense]|nr:hypothetical protein GOBAR_DD15042 [Gossypium barbadense]